jgi:hypothetical protein
VLVDEQLSVLCPLLGKLLAQDSEI